MGISKNYVVNAKNEGSSRLSSDKPNLMSFNSNSAIEFGFNQHQIACEQPVGFSANGEDCDHTDASINPSASEIPGNDVDENCDGEIDIFVNEVEADWNISLYPNPVAQELSLIVTGANGVLNYAIYDAVGKLVLTSQFTAGSGVVRIDVTGIAQGSYTLKVNDKNVQVHTKFVKL